MTSPPLPSLLNALIQTLYSTFRKYSASINWQEALDNRPSTDETIVATVPVRDLPIEIFDHYSWHGLTLQGPDKNGQREEEACLKWCLPRIFDSAIRRSLKLPADNTLVHINYLATRLLEHNWQRWRDNEVAAISQLFDPWLQLLLVENNPAESPDRILALAALLGLPIQPTLHFWSNTPLFPSTLHLAHFINNNLQSLTSHRDLSSWQNLWGPASVPEPTRKHAASWLLHPTTLVRLEAAFFTAPTRDQPALSLAAETLRLCPPAHP